MSRLLTDEELKTQIRYAIQSGLSLDRNVEKTFRLIKVHREAYADKVVGEDLRPIFSGHSFCCIWCGKLGGMCNDPDCTYDEGLNQHVEGVGFHKMLLCDCEKINIKLAEQRERNK